MNKTLKKPTLINGGLALDDRGELTFVNDFDFAEAGIRRFYQVSNHRRGFVRAWHGHKKEAKYVFIPNGAAIVAAVKIDAWDSPSKDLPVERFILSAAKPSLLYIPPGYANGFMTLRQNTLLQFFSTATLQESANDDFRFEARYWNAWDVVER